MRWQWIAAATVAGTLVVLAADNTLSVPPAAGVNLALRGDQQFRRGEFAEAARTFESAANLDPQNAHAWWGLGRVAEIQFQRQKARDLFAKAYRLDPRDTGIIF